LLLEVVQVSVQVIAVTISLKAIKKDLRKDQEIICLNPNTCGRTLPAAQQMEYDGDRVRAKVVKGYEVIGLKSAEEGTGTVQ
jgi:hypothetical protein